MPNTIRLHRVLRTTPEKVYRAFLDPDAKVKWLPPHGFTAKIHHMDPRVGGTYKMSFTNFSTGRSHSFGGTYLELVPHERLRYTDQFDDPNLPGELQVTITLKKVALRGSTQSHAVEKSVRTILQAVQRGGDRADRWRWATSQSGWGGRLTWHRSKRCVGNSAGPLRWTGHRSRW